MIEKEQNQAVAAWLEEQGVKCTLTLDGNWMFVEGCEDAFKPFTQDLNACALCEAELRRNGRNTQGVQDVKNYILTLRAVLDTEGETDLIALFFVCAAKPAQRVEAFLKSLSLWREDEHQSTN